MSQANATLIHTEARRHVAGLSHADAMRRVEAIGLEIAALARAGLERDRLKTADATSLLALSDEIEDLVAARGWS